MNEYPTNNSEKTLSNSLVGNQNNGIILKSFLDIVNCKHTGTQAMT